MVAIYPAKKKYPRLL